MNLWLIITNYYYLVHGYEYFLVCKMSNTYTVYNVEVVCISNTYFRFKNKMSFDENSLLMFIILPPTGTKLIKKRSFRELPERNRIV